MMMPRSLFLIGLLLACVGSAIAGEIQSVPLDEFGKRFQLVGMLKRPMGVSVTVQGVVVDGPFKGYEGGANLRVQRIDGLATQEDIQICIEPYFNKWGEKALAGCGIALPPLDMGKTYEMEGYETGGYVGVPAEAYRKAGAIIQTTGHYFRERFVVYKARRIDAVRFQPADFREEKALMEGSARTVSGKACVQGDDWVVIVDASAGWPADIEGKFIATIGTYAPTKNRSEFSLANGAWYLARLEDQVGRDVELRGRALCFNNEWRFRYRGTDLYVENLERLPGWSDECSGRPMIIRGRLEKARLPRLDEISLKPDRDLEEYFVVRKPQWEPLDKLLGVERAFDDIE